MPAIDIIKSKRRRRNVQPDEVFEAGPLLFARFGRLIVAKNVLTPEEHKKLQDKIPTIYTELERSIAAEVIALRKLLSPLDPRLFLQRAFGEFFLAHLGIEDEPSVTFDDHGVPARMIDYCHSLFAATKPTSAVRPPTNDEFQQIKQHIRHLFRRTQEYIALRAHPAISKTENESLSQLIAKLTYYWVFVRSDRHAYFEIPHHADLFRPLDGILERVLRLTCDDLLRGMERILANAQSGLGDSGTKLFQLFDVTCNHPDFESLFVSKSGYDISDLARLTGSSEAEIEDTVQSFVGTRLFEVKRTTGWPEHFVDLLSYAPGDAAKFLQPAERAAWPTRVWPIFEKPFLRLGDESFCFDHIAFCDRFYRQITRALRIIDPSCHRELKDIQAATVEKIAAKLLARLLPGAKLYSNVFYHYNDELCETDLILTYKDALIIAEVRSGSLTPESPTEDIASYFNSIQNLLLKPSSQAWRLLSKLNEGSIELFDTNKRDRKVVGRLRPSDFKFRIPMTISLDNLHMIGAQIANTVAAMGDNAPTAWAVTLDDLRCFAELFNSPSIFLHFAEVRLRAASHKKVEVLDEMDHVGMYFIENDYVMQSNDFESPLRRSGYTAEIDRYFFKLGSGETAERPKQSVPRYVSEVVDACDKNNAPASRAVASAVLSLDSDSRLAIDNWFAEQFTDPPARRRFRNFTLSCNTNSLSLMLSQSWTLNAIQQAYVEAKARLLTMVKVDATVVALFQPNGNALKLASCSEVIKSRITDQERDSLQPVRAIQERRDFAASPSNIGRNQVCPCGSGLKYKRCHGRQ
jgi:hypothetical protein